MFNPFAYLREKAREAVLAGVHDALTQIDAGAAQPPTPVTSASPPALAPGPLLPTSTPTTPPSGEVAPGATGESIQQRLARAAGAAGVGTAPPQLPPAPSAPKRGRSRPSQTDES